MPATQPFIYHRPPLRGVGGSFMTLSRVIDGEPSPNGLRRIGVVQGVQHDSSVAPMPSPNSQPEGLSHRGGIVLRGTT